MAGGDRPGSAGLQITGGKNLANGQAVGREVAIAESARLIGIIENDQPPGSVDWLRTESFLVLHLCPRLGGSRW